MSMNEKHGNDAVYSNGWLFTDRRPSGDGRPNAMHGCVKNEAGLAAVTVDYFGINGGPWTQTVYAETIRDARVVSVRQERSRTDYLTERGIKTVVGRWLRWVDEVAR